MADIAATARALGLSERDIRAQQEALQKGFQAQPRHAASREADSKADIAATARDLGLSERDLLEQQSAYSGHTAACESRPSSGRAPIPKHQTGDLNVTNASHVYDCKLAKKLLPPGTLPKEQQKALDRFLTLTVNLPVKTRSGPGGNFGSHPDSDNVLDTEIMNALGTRQPLSDGALARVRAKVALVKGMAKDAGLSDDSIKSLILPLVVLRGPNGTTVDERYPVVYENGKPVNIWKDQPSAETGLKDNGEPDLRTIKGRERAANAKTFAQDTGLTKDGQADERTKHGQHLGVPKAEMRASFTGKKKDGTPDMRTKLGKQIEEARVHKQANVPVVESSSKSDESLSAQSTPQKKPPAHTLPSPSPEAAAKLVERASRALEGQHQRTQQEALQRAARARDTGLRLDGAPDMRTTLGRLSTKMPTPPAAQTQPMEAATPSRPAARITGLRLDGAPDMRTTLGRQLSGMRGDKDGTSMHHHPQAQEQHDQHQQQMMMQQQQQHMLQQHMQHMQQFHHQQLFHHHQHMESGGDMGGMSSMGGTPYLSSRHTGPRTADGSLDMRFAANRGHDKWLD